MTSRTPAATSPRARRSPTVATLVAIALVVLAVTGGFIGRSLRAGEPTLPVAGPLGVVAGASQASSSPGVGGSGLAIGSGRPEPNPGGGPDLRADPEAGLTGTAPIAPAGAEVRDLPDATALAALRRGYGEPATAPTTSGAATGIPELVPSDPGTIRAFVDPCVRTPSGPGCQQGQQALVLGYRQAPAFQTLWVGEIRKTDLYAGECARQFPTAPIDWRTDTIFAAVVNQPVIARLDLQLNTPGVLASLIRISHPGVVVTAEAAAPSADLVAAWAEAFARGTQTPGIPLCLKVSRQVMDTNRDGCLGELHGTTWYDCAATFALSIHTGCTISTTDPLCARLDDALGRRAPAGVAAGPFAFGYSYDPQWSAWDPQFAGSGLSEADLRRPVRFAPVDALNVEVRIPMVAVTLGEATAPDSAAHPLEGRIRSQQAQRVAAAGYPPGTDCRTVDPAILSTTLPVTRQAAQTRYWTPDPGTPASREAVVNLTMPPLAQGEAVDICVLWYLLPSRSYDNPVVTAIERHTVVPPARAATEVSVVGQPTLDRWTFQVIGDRFLTAACGFPNGATTAATLRPLGDPGFLCRVEESRFLFDPGDIELFTTDALANRTEGRTRIWIDNRGCMPSGCGPARSARIPLSDGSGMDLVVRKVPYASNPLLPGGRVVSDWSADQWRIDPAGFAAVAPQLRTPVRQSAPTLDTFGVRVEPSPASPSTALDLIWQADREVTLGVSATSVVPADRAPGCPTTFLGPTTTPASSGRLTVPGLCAGTDYALTVTLTDAATGQSRRYAGLQGGLALVGRTAAAPVPADFLAAWSVTLAEPPVSGGPGAAEVQASMTALRLALGGRTLVSRADPAARCTAYRPGTELAAGFERPAALGQLRLEVSYVLAAPGPAGCSGPPGIATFSVDADIVWDGRSERTVLLRAADGRSVRVVLRPAAGD